MAKRSPRWSFFSRFDIRDETTGELYLRRWYLLATPWFSLLLHKIVTPDKDRDLHDHPWWFLSFMLWGGYDEIRLLGRATDPIGSTFYYDTTIKRRCWLSLAFRAATAAHRIISLRRAPTWTLLLTGPRRCSWGFHTAKGYIDWKVYLGGGP